MKTVDELLKEKGFQYGEDAHDNAKVGYDLGVAEALRDPTPDELIPVIGYAGWWAVKQFLAHRRGELTKVTIEKVKG